MPAKWQMQEAKAKFAELVRRANSQGPQVVTYRGTDAAVVLSMEEYRRLKEPQRSFLEHLLSEPKWDDEIVDMINDRSRDTGRDIDL